MSRDVPPGNVPQNESQIAAQHGAEFAARLRVLRAEAGSPSFRQLAKITNYSSSTLADATSGRRLPTEPVLKALVSACGADPDPWLEELRQITAAGQAGRPDSAPGKSGQDANMSSDTPVPGSKRPSLAVLAGLAAVAAVFGAGLGTGWLLAPAASSAGQRPVSTFQELPGVPLFSGTPSPAPAALVSDGADPVAGHCVSGARMVDSKPVVRGGTPIGALELWYSSKCGAGWARVYLYQGEPTMLGEATVRSGDDRFAAFTDPLVGSVPVYTDVIVPGPGGCLGAGGAVWGQGIPVITVSIPCQAPPGG